MLYREKDGQAIKYVFLNKQQVARIGGDTRYIHTDLLGSPVVESDASGNPIASTRMHYRPFGATVEQAKDEVGYTGHKFDTDTQLSYMQQRYYDPAIGRFYSNDPVGFTGEVDTFNRYLYVANNPYKYLDPDGREKLKLIGSYQMARGKGFKVYGGISFDSESLELAYTVGGGPRLGFANSKDFGTKGWVDGNTQPSGKNGLTATIKANWDLSAANIAAQGDLFSVNSDGETKGMSEPIFGGGKYSKNVVATVGLDVSITGSTTVLADIAKNPAEALKFTHGGMIREVTAAAAKLFADEDQQ